MKTLDSVWENYVEVAANTFRAVNGEKEKLSSSTLARFVSILPHIAGCEDADKCGFINLCLYVIERTKGKPFFLHKKEDDKDVLHRLDPFKRNLKGGDQTIVDAGMARLGLMMLEDYKADMDSDHKEGKYNPLNEKAWDFDTMKKELLVTAKLSDNPDLNAALSPDESLRGWWER